MAALHEALKTLGPLEYSSAPKENLQPFLTEAFSAGQLIVDSVPIPAPTDSSPLRSRASSASSASEILPSQARSAPPPPNVEALQKEWKSVKVAANVNPLGMSVYKCGGKDGKGAWFARRSVHEGLGFSKWKRALEREFPETMKVQGGPGEGNIRGIGGERRVEFENVEGVGKVEVYLLSAQFPGPTTPRDFVTMFLTSDQALQKDENGECPRHFMVISRPCIHPDTPARDGFIRGQYESVEFIREIPIIKKKSSSTTNFLNSGLSNARKRSSSLLSREAIVQNASQNFGGGENETGPQDDAAHGDSGRARGHTISFDHSRGATAKGERMDVPPEEDIESNPIEWIMITRSDPGGSVPRFMIERGTPGGIVSDASKFLDWACSKDIDDLQSDEEMESETDKAEKKEYKQRQHDHERDLHNYQTNGHLAGIEESSSPQSEYLPALPPRPVAVQNGPFEEKDAEVAYNSNAYSSGLYSMINGAAGMAGGFIASHAPQVVTDHLPTYIHQPSQEPLRGELEETTAPASLRRDSTSTLSSVSSVGSFASALSRADSEERDRDHDTSSLQTTQSDDPDTKATAIKAKELAKLAEKKRKLDEKLEKAKSRERSKSSADTSKEEEAIRKHEERHQRELRKLEEKEKKELDKLERKKAKEERKVEERRKKRDERDEKTRVAKELEDLRGEVGMLRKEREILRTQVGDLQRENTALAVRVGRLGALGEEVLRDVRKETGKGVRSRASSLKGLSETRSSFRSGGSGGSKEGSKLGETS
ncbi:hypothetical protein HYALB_00000041 [Hymenoscyphus albidus]|uniref:DUF3074 domain-containing protein n=1 Tax=Hymenoscyphus albidus TaxID=595503 RepID=A0A9N9LDN4_9HELO|nr:hypothetical protein HYALB_00000041 [Hymenoscyphus albidus]